jgi:hypothetical protein
VPKENEIHFATKNLQLYKEVGLGIEVAMRDQPPGAKPQICIGRDIIVFIPLVNKFDKAGWG